MQDYDIKRGHHHSFKERGLETIIGDIFGKVETEDGVFITSYGGLKMLRVRMKSPKVLEVDTTMDPSVEPEVAGETIRLYNEFLRQATGFSTKERKKRMSKK